MDITLIIIAIATAAIFFGIGKWFGSKSEKNLPAGSDVESDLPVENPPNTIDTDKH